MVSAVANLFVKWSLSQEKRLIHGMSEPDEMAEFVKISGDLG